MGLGGNYLTQRLILVGLDRSQFTPVVVAPVEGIALDEFRKMGIECIVVPPEEGLGSYGGTILKRGFFGRIKTAVELFRYNLKLAGFLKEKHIDVVYTNCVRAQMSVGFGARFAGIPSLLYIKGELNNPLIDRISFLLADRILFFCDQNRHDNYPLLMTLLKSKTGILKIGMDLAVIDMVLERDKSSLRNEFSIAPSAITIAVVGQLYRPKGQHFVLQALASLIDDFSDIRVFFLGDHVIDEYRPYRDELDQLIADFNLKKNVIFTGWRREALDIVSLMDIVIHPSLSEGFGRAVLEAMALGKPVIASRVGGLREAIIDGKNGFLVDPGDVDTIAERWRQLLLDSGLRARLGQEARKTVFAEYGIDDKIAQLSKIWTKMAGGES